jgi:hypothetical protein
MNQSLKRSLWVVALGIAVTGLSTSSVTAAVPAQQDRAQQDQDHDRNQSPARSDNQRGDKAYFQQGFQDSQQDRQFGGNSNDHQQPKNANDLRAYQDGYQQGFRNTTSGPKAPGRAKRSIRFWGRSRT